jgi:hypothetical protein
MTPLAGFVIAVIAAWIARDARRAAAIFVVPFLAVTAGQTWGIGAGRGVSPPSTVWPLGPAISYYVVQAIIMALAISVAIMLGAVRGRRVTGRNEAADRRRRTRIAAVVEVILTGAYLAAAVLDSAPVLRHSASGSPPPQGLIGIGVLVLSPIVLGVLLITGRRSAARPGADQPGADQPAAGRPGAGRPASQSEPRSATRA